MVYIIDILIYTSHILVYIYTILLLLLYRIESPSNNECIYYLAPQGRVHFVREKTSFTIMPPTLYIRYTNTC